MNIVTLHVTCKPYDVTCRELLPKQPCAIYKIMSASAKVGKAVRRIRQAQKRSAEDLGEAIDVSKVEMTRPVLKINCKLRLT